MGCGSSSPQPVHQNGGYPPQHAQPQQQNNNNNNYPPKNQYPPPPILQPQNQPQQQQQPRPQPTAPPQQQPLPPQPRPAQQEPPPIESTEVDTPLPDVLQQSNTVDESTENTGAAVELSAEVLKEFVDLDKEIQALESKKAEEKIALHQIEYKNVDEAYKSMKEELETLKQQTLKEYDDVAKFDLVAYMVENKMKVIDNEQMLDEQKRKEEYEYCEARNKQDIAERQLKSLEVHLDQISKNIEDCQIEIEKLSALRIKVDGLLENVFNGEYGSELEDRLELEAEQLLQYKKHLSLAHYKWWNGRQLLHHACSQIAYSVRRWVQIRDVVDDNGATKYHMVTDTRNHMIACHQNIQRTAGYLNMQLPYWNMTDDKNIVASINVIYNDVKTGVSYQKAMRWYRYYHWRLALLLNWMDQVINNKIVADHHRVSKDFRNKYRELRRERLRCIKEKVKEILGTDLDIDQFEKTEDEEDYKEEDDLPKVVSDVAMNPQEFTTDGDTIEMPDATESEMDPTLVESVIMDPGTLKAIAESISTSTETNTEAMATDTSDMGTDAEGVQTSEMGTDSANVQTSEFGTEAMNVQTSEMGIGTDPIPTESSEMGTGTETQVTAPEVRLIPLNELAPPPSDELLFGNVEQLQLMHQKQIEEFEKVQESNKARQEQGLQDKLRQRQSKRRKQKLQEEQANALTSQK